MLYIEIVSIAYDLMNGSVGYQEVVTNNPEIKETLDEILIDNDCPDIIVNI